jgi:hypothetical protein
MEGRDERWPHPGPRDDETMPINRNWSWILIAAVAALVIAIWLPYRGMARAATQAYVFPEENPNYVPPTVDNDTKLSPFPDNPGHSRR